MSNISPHMVLRRATAAQKYGGKSQSVSWSTVGRIFTFARRHRARMVAYVLLSALAALLGVITPILSGRVVNAITDGGPVSTIVWLAVAMGVIALLDAALSLINRWFSAQVGEGLIFDLRTAVFDHVQTMPVAFFNRTRTGALISRLSTDVMGAQRAFANTLPSVASNLVALVLTLGVMFAYSWQVTVLSLVLLPIYLLPARLLASKLAKLQFEASDLNAAMSTRMTERFNAGGATLVKLFGSPERESAQFAQRADRVRAIGVRTAMLQTTFVTALTLVSALALALVYGLGGFEAVQGHLNAGMVVTLAMLLTRLYAPLTMLANARMDFVSAVVSFERIFEILDLKPIITEPAHPRALPSGALSVEFDDVRFTYPTSAEVSLASLEDVAVLDTREYAEVLHGISFTVPAGSTVALVGSSGAGKSTIASLVPRLYDPTSGCVRLGGIDARDLAFADLKAGVGMVTQDGHLFHDSIRENLLLAKPNATDEEINSALRRARMDRVVEALPDGVDTVIGERGYRLSGGERQRLTIARLLLAAPPIVVLDEATSALDSTNEVAVQQALNEAMTGRTAIVIAHRLSTVRSASQILVIEGGRIVERGAHSELLSAGGRYAELYETQFADQETT
ncbi:ABC transporter ATP-binding protein [Brevibacterium sp. UMB1308A]|uniref:ABC transporter ATP-binding protein n=1 Tax=Brevibacterium sp. UMB1308A TaxID=3050608 RepID=UPI00254C784D|nr:ABC transporter ATP-binding protein [Brevibacterium sp. UMB1308A]MDK8345549.1 ABC transporter ATP-binding protein [Brevibacterium sp. UMB1308B]MDK8712606.1 ABC transporter ATP-binding protein [Brevibacterium sp. UMB1308A]